MPSEGSLGRVAKTAARAFVLVAIGGGEFRLVQAQAKYSLFKGPQAENKSISEWISDKKAWRATTISENNITFDVYNDAAVNWTRLTFVQPQVHLWDRYLYDGTTHQYTVKRYLDDLKERYGGIDSVLLWPTYPNIGIDARNQFDLVRALPGGLEGVKELTRQFHEAGVRVLWAYNPFDQGLRPEGEPHWTALAKMLKETGGDGFNGDTMAVVYKDFYDAAREIGHPIVGEAELGNYAHEDWTRPEDNTWVSANYNTLGWGYYFASFSGPDGSTTFWKEPGVDRAKWLDPRGRRQTHVCDRWAKDRHDAMQFAHFNGVGYESWENVWGVYMTFTRRDAAALKRLQPVWRWLGRSDYTSNHKEWVPYAPEITGEGIYASRWVRDDGTCAWTVVNRDSETRTFEFDVPSSGCHGSKMYDLFDGTPIGKGRHTLPIDSLGYGAYALVDDAASVVELFGTMTNFRGRLLSTIDATWAPIQQLMLPLDPPEDAQRSAALTADPPGSVFVGRARYHFQTGGREIEGGCDAAKDTAQTGNCCEKMVMCPSWDQQCFDMCAFGGPDTRGVDVQFPWEAEPGRFHDAYVDIGPFYIDRYPVTNAEFKVFLDATGYKPRDPYHFLEHWVDGSPKPSDAKKPVRWVTFDEAKRYCAWAGKRLPHSYEWQLAAQGTDGRTYPWGPEMNKTFFPEPWLGGDLPEFPDVGSFPAGDSPYGMSDAIGLVWQYTDSFQDDRTRSVILKGSSLYNPMLSDKYPASPQVGNWYFPTAHKVTQHNRLMVMDESYDRAGTVGFRCVADHADGAPGPYHWHSVSSGSAALLQAASADAAVAHCLRHGGARGDCRREL